MQYGQRKLQRSMTEMRRSCIGRPSVSRTPVGRGQARDPVSVDGSFIGSPRVEIELAPRGILRGPRRQLDETVRAEQRNEIARAARGRGSPSAWRRRCVKPHRQEEPQRRLQRMRGSELRGLRRGRARTMAAASAGTT